MRFNPLPLFAPTNQASCEELSSRRVGWLYSQATHLGSPTSPSLFIIPPFNSQRISVEPSLLLFLFTFLPLVYITVRLSRIFQRVAYYFIPNLQTPFGL